MNDVVMEQQAIPTTCEHVDGGAYVHAHFRSWGRRFTLERCGLSSWFRWRPEGFVPSRSD